MNQPTDKEAFELTPGSAYATYATFTREQLIEKIIALEQAQCHDLAKHRRNLIREVHHRIKNNLQGVTGLLRLKANQHPELTSVIDQTIGQVHAVAVVHGLQGKVQDSEVVLCEMVPAIAKAVEALLAPLLVNFLILVNYYLFGCADEKRTKCKKTNFAG
jgi:Histidine kinase